MLYNNHELQIFIFIKTIYLFILNSSCCSKKISLFYKPFFSFMKTIEIGEIIVVKHALNIRVITCFIKLDSDWTDQHINLGINQLIINLNH